MRTKLFRMLLLSFFFLFYFIDVGSGAAASFEDTANHWAKNVIQSLYEKGIVKGAEEKQFEPDSTLTKAEFITMLHRALKHYTQNKLFSELPAEAGKHPFSDVDEQYYYSDLLNDLVTLGIVDDHGTFAPDRAITREQAVHYLFLAVTKMNNVNPEKLAAPNDLFFSDNASISQRYKKAIFYLTKQWRIVNGYQGGYFYPKKILTRAEGAVFVSRLLDILSKNPYIVSIVPDDYSYKVYKGNEGQFFYKAHQNNNILNVYFYNKVPQGFAKKTFVCYRYNKTLEIILIYEPRKKPESETTYEQYEMTFKNIDIDQVIIKDQANNLIKRLSVIKADN